MKNPLLLANPLWSYDMIIVKLVVNYEVAAICAFAVEFASFQIVAAFCNILKIHGNAFVVVKTTSDAIKDIADQN